jgi:hypothetical protein
MLAEAAGVDGGDFVGGGFAGEVAVDEVPVLGIGHVGRVASYIRRPRRENPHPTLSGLDVGSGVVGGG